MARLLLVGLLGLLAFTSLLAAATDLEFQSEQASRAAFTDFALNFNGNPAIPIPGNGKVTPQSITQVPFLATLPQRGVSQNLVTLNACAVNQPHVHPRGSEVSYIIKGPLEFGFMEENGGRQNITVLAQPGQSIVIPQGLMHFAMNLNCEPASFIATFPDRDAGTQTIASNFFAFPDYVLKATLNGLDDDTLNKVIAAAKNTANPSVEQACLARCNAGKTTSVTPAPVSNMPTNSHMGTNPTNHNVCLAIKDPYAQQLCNNCLNQHIDPYTCIKCGAPGIADVAGCYNCLAQKIPTANADGSDCVKCASDAHISASCLNCLVQRKPPGYCQQGTFSG